MAHINSLLWHFEINADISILDKSVILGLPFCVFTGYSVLTFGNCSLTYWIPNRIKTIGFGKLFDDWVCQVLLEMHQKFSKSYTMDDSHRGYDTILKLSTSIPCAPKDFKHRYYQISSGTLKISQ